MLEVEMELDVDEDVTVPDVKTIWTLSVLKCTTKVT